MCGDFVTGFKKGLVALELGKNHRSVVSSDKQYYCLYISIDFDVSLTHFSTFLICTLYYNWLFSQFSYFQIKILFFFYPKFLWVNISSSIRNLFKNKCKGKGVKFRPKLAVRKISDV